LNCEGKYWLTKLAASNLAYSQSQISADHQPHWAQEPQLTPQQQQALAFDTQEKVNDVTLPARAPRVESEPSLANTAAQPIGVIRRNFKMQVYPADAD
jgi:hypothetical protein